MNASLLAHAIAGDLWEFGRIVLILFGACGWNWFLRRGRDYSDSASLGGILLIATCSVGAFCLFLFLNIQMGNILALSRAAPLWGSFSVVAVFALVISVGLVTHQQLGASRDDISLSILDVAQPKSSWLSPKKTLIGLLAALLCGFASVIWLLLISHGMCIV